MQVSAFRYSLSLSRSRARVAPAHTTDWHFSWSSSRGDSKCSPPWRWTNRRGASPHENANCISLVTTRALGHYFMVIGWVLKCGAYLPGGFSVSLATTVTPRSHPVVPFCNRPVLTWNIKKHEGIRYARAIVLWKGYFARDIEVIDFTEKRPLCQIACKMFELRPERPQKLYGTESRLRCR